SLLGPGPKYKLKTLVGYQEHCISKYRNPAYSFGNQFFPSKRCEIPGPKYLLPDPKRGGFSFGLIGRTFGTSCTPGPKYVLPSSKNPAFSLKFRTKYRGSCATPGPYYVKLPREGPAFFMGIRLPPLKCDPVPGPYSYTDKQCTPKYTILPRRDYKIVCHSPGPVYDIKPPKPTPAYSFGVRHSECAPPYIVECDDQC
ncbi:Outer dense fiber protein 3, partial [Dufourea novaeangliae]